MQKTTLAAVATAAALILIVGIATTGQTRWIVPLGVVLLAAASAFLIALPRTTSETPRKRDERGITLQTLIVTAVLVLMAGAAGVVIIAITNNANDNLEGQNSGIDSRCRPWEIFDPSLDAAGRGGGNGGIHSSAIGCVRVCYVRARLAGATANLNDMNDKLAAESNAATDWELVFSRSQLAVGIGKAASGGNPATKTIGVIIGDRTGSRTNVAEVDDDKAEELVEDNQRIEVATNQRYCRVWDDTTDEEVAELRSE